jgi:Fe-S oxidoreductase
MTDPQDKQVNTNQIRSMLNHRKGKMKRLLSHCVHCSICAESCFLYMAHGKDPQYMPSYKMLNSLGKLYSKRGRVTRETLDQMKGIVWRNCVLCGRCYCPIGINIPSLITMARSIIRSQGVYPQKEETESWL